jgi:hypothetical protein
VGSHRGAQIVRRVELYILPKCRVGWEGRKVLSSKVGDFAKVRSHSVEGEGRSSAAGGVVGLVVYFRLCTYPLSELSTVELCVLIKIGAALLFTSTHPA